MLMRSMTIRRREIALQALPQFRAGAKEETFHRRDRLIERIRDLLVAQFLVAAQDYGHALILGQVGDSGVNGLLELVVEQGSVRRDRVVVLDGTFLFVRLRLQGHRRMA